MTDRISYAPREIPAVTGVPYTRIRAAIEAGELATVQTSPKRRVVMHGDLITWLESLRQSA